MNKTSKRFLQKLGIINLIVIFYYIQILMMNPHSTYWSDNNRTFLDFFGEFVFSMFIFALLYECSIYITSSLNKIYPWKDRPIRRLIIQFAVQALFILIFISILNVLLSFFFSGYQHGKGSLVYLLQLTVISMTISLLIAAIHTGSFLLLNWKRSGIEAAEMKLKAARLDRLAAQSELQILKLQLDPHFIFNNFSTLSELIDFDPKTAQLFLKNLSKVYRYLVKNSVKDLITVEEEIDFISSYIYLMRIRHGESIKFSIQIEQEVLYSVLPPLTMQLLIENAITHNQVSDTNPLIIEISSGNGMIMVCNNILPITKASTGSGTGIQNILRRYLILSQDEPQFMNDGKVFKVTLPILSRQNI